MSNECNCYLRPGVIFPQDLIMQMESSGRCPIHYVDTPENHRSKKFKSKWKDASKPPAEDRKHVLLRCQIVGITDKVVIILQEGWHNKHMKSYIDWCGDTEEAGGFKVLQWQPLPVEP